MSGASASVPSRGKPAIAEVIAAGTIVDEADNLITELGVLQDFFGHDTSELAGAGDQDSLEADAGLPSPLEHLADELARVRTSARR